jgi:hypothetical protein
VDATSQGTAVKTEKLSYQAWQRQRYGNSLKVRAPGMFLRMLERKAATGGELIAFGNAQHVPVPVLPR